MDEKLGTALRKAGREDARHRIAYRDFEHAIYTEHMSHQLRPELEPLLLFCCSAIGADPATVHNPGVFLWQCLGTMDVCGADNAHMDDRANHRANTQNSSTALALKSKDRELHNNSNTQQQGRKNSTSGAGGSSKDNQLAVRKSSTTASLLDVSNQKMTASDMDGGVKAGKNSTAASLQKHGKKNHSFTQVSNALSRGFMQVDEAFKELFEYQNAFAFYNMDTIEKFGDYVQRGKGHGDGGPTAPAWREQRFQPLKPKAMQKIKVHQRQALEKVIGVRRELREGPKGPIALIL